MSGINLLKCCCSEEIKCVDCVGKHTSNHVIIVSREYYWSGTKTDCSDPTKKFYVVYPNALIVEEPEFFYLNGYSPGTITVPNFSYTFNPNTWFTGTCSLERRTLSVSFYIDWAVRVAYESPPPAGWDCDPVVKSCCARFTHSMSWGSCLDGECEVHAGYSIIQEGKDGDVTITADGYEMHLPTDIYPPHTGRRYFIQPCISLRGLVCPT